MRQTLPQKSLPSLKNNLDLLQKSLGQSDPSSFIQNYFLNNNPQLKTLMQTFNNSGMTAKQFFYQYAQQKGIDPDQFLNS
jgi:hypothetical protein